ncbi:MAG: diguanylate cyclase [Pseudomonadota bacterium]
MLAWNPSNLLPVLIDNIDTGIFVLDTEFNVVLWNRFMVSHSGKHSTDVIGHNIFDMFPELPKKWFEKKIQSVLLLKNFSFTSWEQRPWLFPFAHNRPITGGIDYMQQNCVLMPLENPSTQEIEFISVVIFDVTDTALYQKQLSEALNELEQTSITDGLTRIYNRRHLQASFNLEFSRANRHKFPLSMIMFDLDHFKKINDTYGHPGGDEVLREVAKRVKPLVRTEDVFGRYGGEEFCVLMPDTTLEGAIAVAERIRSVLQSVPVQFGNLHIAMSASLGVSTLTSEIRTHQELLQLADESLYDAKHNGRNCVSSRQMPVNSSPA